MKSCQDCGTPSIETRCPACQRRREQERGSRQERGYDVEYDRLRRQVLAEGDVCYLCGEGPREGDPFQVHHVKPLARGGQNIRDNLEPAHRSCNIARGARVD